MGLSSNRTRFAAQEMSPLYRRGPITGGTTDAMHCATGLREADKDKAAVARALANWRIIADAAARRGIDPAILAGIGVRESGYRNIVERGGGNGRGVFQIDIGENPDVSGTQAMDVAWAADWAAARIAANLRNIRSRFPRFTKAQALQAAIAAYNLGTREISGNPDTIDVATPGDNFGRNVLDIARCF